MNKINAWLERNFLFIILNLMLYFYIGFHWYYRTGYFESSLGTQKTTIYTNTDTIITQKFYKDLSDNYILLDKKIVVPDKEITHILVETGKVMVVRKKTN